MSSNKEFTEAELCDLLDSTLDDFCRKEDTLTTGNNNDATAQSDGQTAASASSTSTSKATKSTSQSPSPPQSDAFSVFESDPQIRESWTKIIKSCNDESTDFNELGFQESLQEALKLMTEKLEDMPDKDVVNEDELMKAFKNLEDFKMFDEQAAGAKDATGSANINNIMPLMSDIMQNMLSKEFLYPSLVDLQNKYPEYLAENRGKIPTADYERYSAQYEIVQKICEEFELETEADSKKVKAKRFQQILQYMQSMQSYGSPPDNLLSSANGDSKTSAGLPDLSQFDNQAGCCLM